MAENPNGRAAEHGHRLLQIEGRLPEIVKEAHDETASLRKTMDREVAELHSRIDGDQRWWIPFLKWGLIVVGVVAVLALSQYKFIDLSVLDKWWDRLG